MKAQHLTPQAPTCQRRSVGSPIKRLLSTVKRSLCNKNRYFQALEGISGGQAESADKSREGEGDSACYGGSSSQLHFEFAGNLLLS